MEKVSSDKLIKKKLEDETGVLLREALKKHLPPSDSEATTKVVIKGIKGKELVIKGLEERFGEIARTEVFKKGIEFIGSEGTEEEKQVHKKLMEAMPKVVKVLESELGDEFLGASLFGSHIKNYAGESSDADIRVFVKHKYFDNYGVFLEKYESLRNMVKGILDDVKSGGMRIDFIIEGIDNVKGHINSVKKGADGRIEEKPVILDDGRMVYDILEVTGAQVLAFFDGKFWGGKIEESRKEIIVELAKSPCGELIWEKALQIRDRTESSYKRGISDEDLQEVLEARKDVLNFGEMKKRYEVT